MARLVAALTRVSSAGQDLTSQRHAIEKAATERGDKIKRWYEEKFSGKTLARPQMDRLRADVRAGLVSRVYCFKLDRVTRSGIADAYKVVAEFRAAGTELLAVADGLHVKPGPEDLASEVLVFALALCARIERSAILDRQAAARAAMRAAGRAWGRPPTTTTAEREKVIAMSASRTVREIAVAMKIPRSSVHRILKQASHKSRPIPPSSNPGLALPKPSPRQKCAFGTR